MSRFVLFALCLASSFAYALTPPVAKRVAHPVTVHGDTREDFYAWIKNRNDPDTETYLKAENAFSDEVLAPIRPLQKQIYDEMVAHFEQSEENEAFETGGYRYFPRYQEGSQYPVWYRTRSGETREEAVLDVNELAKGKPLLRLGDFVPSDDGRYLAYSVDLTGYLAWEMHVRDLRAGLDLPEVRKPVASCAWAADNHTLFYTTKDASMRPYRLYRHRLGDREDELLFEESDPRYRTLTWRSRGKNLILTISTSKDSTEIRYVPAASPEAAPRVLQPRRPHVYYNAEELDGNVYLRLNDKGLNHRLVTAPLSSLDETSWKELVPERAGVLLSDTLLFRGHVVLHEWEGARPQLGVLDLASGKIQRVKFPEPVYNVTFGDNPSPDSKTFRVFYTSPVTPTEEWEISLETLEKRVISTTKVPGYDRSRYTTELRFATAADGARVPVSLVYRKGLERDGSAPLLLEGYGAYGNSSRDEFDSKHLSLLDRGVIYAIAHVRGGSEWGNSWYEQGRLLHKRNSFMDFVTAAEYLVDEKYTSPERLGIGGLSAGGLLMAASINLRPDLFRASLVRVPFVDVLNTQLDPMIPLVTEEYEEWGDPAKTDEYFYMKSYCPYDNLTRTAYPAMLVRASWNDGQVPYWEPAKYVAKLRTLKTDERPLILLTNFSAGHAGGSGRYAKCQTASEDYAFLLWQLGVSVPTIKAR